MANVRFAIFSAGSTSSTPSFDPSHKDGQGGGGWGGGKRKRMEWRMRPCAIPTIRLIIILNRFANTATRSSIVLSFLLPLLCFLLRSCPSRYVLYTYVRIFFFFNPSLLFRFLYCYDF